MSVAPVKRVDKDAPVVAEPDALPELGCASWQDQDRARASGPFAPHDEFSFWTPADVLDMRLEYQLQETLVANYM